MNWGSPLLRAGIGKRVELRFGGDGFVNAHATCEGRVTRALGWSDFGVGAKIALVDESGWRPAFSAIPAFSVPIGGRSVTNSAFDPSLTLAWSKNLPEKWSAGGTLGYASITDQGRRFAQRAVTVSVGHSIWAGMSGFLEAYDVSPTGLDGRPAWMLDGGVTHGVGKNAQVDFSMGRRFLGATSCWFASVGFVTRAGHMGSFVSSMLRQARL